MDINLNVTISFSSAVMALLASASSGALVASAAAPVKPTPTPTPATAPVADAPSEAGATVGAASGEVDAGGHPWSEALHASTRGTTKDGYWRMKVGVSRPANLPGFPKDGAAGAATSTPAAGGATGTAGAAPAASQTGSAPVDEEDEFAAFRAATDAQSAPVAAVARTWTDADLSALCNQAAVKLGDPAPIKEVVAQFIPDGVVNHSRNIPAEHREAFAKAMEAKAGITFAG